MTTPLVSFVVPCYKLAHLLPECVRSILSQTYRDLEVLVMDDCSPDDTAAVARSFADPRVIHVRNDPNLGHLRNYNKGIGLARGKYVWLISADDYLRRPHVLQRYVDVLERHPRVGYAFCAGVGIRDGVETGILDYSVRGEKDRVISGHRWLQTILRQNVVLAASGMVRRDCYDRLGAFPLDMPWAGDWYLWCLFALHFDVAYFAEPMVCYREHALSMTQHLTRGQAEACCREEIAIPWDVKKRAEAAGYRRVVRDCLLAVSEAYARSVASTRFGMSEPYLSLEGFEASLSANTTSDRERDWVRARVYAGMGNEYFWQGRLGPARELYDAALGKDRWMATVAAKRTLLSLGPLGSALRRVIRSAARGAP